MNNEMFGVQQQLKGFSKLFKAQARMQAQEKEAAQAEKVKTILIDVHSKMFDKASAYANVMLAAGYAGGFALLGATRAQLPARAVVAIALALGSSLCVFVLFEVWKMQKTSSQFMKQHQWLNVEKPPEQFMAELKSFQDEQSRLVAGVVPVWTWVVRFTVVTALIAIALLFYNYLAVLIGLPQWPA